MKPILYESDEELFSNQGLGVLSDVISCSVTEERNGKFELIMKYPTNGHKFEEIKKNRLILAKPNEISDSQPFCIYRITKPMRGTVTVYAEHISYRMSFIPVKPFTATTVSEALLGLENNAIEECPFSFWTDKDTVANFKLKEPKSMRSILGGTEGSILDIYGGGEWEFDRFTAKLYQNRGANHDVTIRYGKNLIDLTQEENISNTITGIVPFWKDQESGEIVTVDGYVVWSDSAQNYPFPRTIPMDFSSKFQNKPTKEQLKNAAESYVQSNNIGIPNISIKLSFAALWQSEEYKSKFNVEKIGLCDTVNVEFEELGISATAKVIRTVYNCILERYETIEIGEPKTNLAKAIQDTTSDIKNTMDEDFATKTLLLSSISRATSLISGGLGGYVVTRLNADGHPEELLILGDSDDYEVATKVWRWNKDGLGYSGTGYNGNYRTAITKDGHIVADFIDTGTLTANIIKAGVLEDEAGLNYWNMATGEFRLTQNSVSIDGDSMADFVYDSLDQNKVFTKLTGNNQNGIYLQNGILYIDASYIRSGTVVADIINGGTLTLGGANNSKGTLQILDIFGNVAVSGSSSGFNINSGSIVLTGSNGTVNISDGGLEHTGYNRYIGIRNGKITTRYTEADYFTSMSGNGLTFARQRKSSSSDIVYEDNLFDIYVNNSGLHISDTGAAVLPISIKASSIKLDAGRIDFANSLLTSPLKITSKTGSENNNLTLYNDGFIINANRSNIETAVLESKATSNTNYLKIYDPLHMENGQNRIYLGAKSGRPSLVFKSKVLNVTSYEDMVDLGINGSNVPYLQFYDDTGASRVYMSATDTNSTFVLTAGLHRIVIDPEQIKFQSRESLEATYWKTLRTITATQYS